MQRAFPFIAFGLGMLLGIIVFSFGAKNPEADYQLPLLTQLIMTEFGFILTAVATAIGIHDLSKNGAHVPRIALLLGNLVLSIGLLSLGIQIWPATTAG